MQFHADPGAAVTARGVADERSVDVDEVRDQPPQPEDGPPIPGKLSPVQEAQRRRAAHARICGQCADIDRSLCPVGERLWRDWTAALDDAYDRLHGGTA